MGWHETVNTIIALTGAATGIIALWHQRRDATIRLSVSLEIPSDGRVNTWIEAWNLGRVNARLDLTSFQLKHHRGYLDAFPLYEPIDDSFKVDLLSGERARIYTSQRDLKRKLQEEGLSGQIWLQASVCDTTGRTFKSRRVRTIIEQ